jgi:hypothetical protein
MLRRGLLVLALSAGLIGLGSAPAQAIPPGNNLIVVAYFADAARTHLIGQRWSGCGQPAGSWGTLSGYSTLYFTPC